MCVENKRAIEKLTCSRSTQTNNKKRKTKYANLVYMPYYKLLRTLFQKKAHNRISKIEKTLSSTVSDPEIELQF